MLNVNDFWDEDSFWVRFWVAYKIGETLGMLRGSERRLSPAENQSMRELSRTLVCGKVPLISFADGIAFPAEFWVSLAVHLRKVKFGVEWGDTPLFKQDQWQDRWQSTRGAPSFHRWVELYIGTGLGSSALSHILRLGKPSLVAQVDAREDFTSRLYSRPKSLVALVTRSLDGGPTKSRAPRGMDLSVFDSAPDVLLEEALPQQVYRYHRPAG